MSESTSNSEMYTELSAAQERGFRDRIGRLAPQLEAR
jgi:hypothetical protein